MTTWHSSGRATRQRITDILGAAWEICRAAGSERPNRVRSRRGRGLAAARGGQRRTAIACLASAIDPSGAQSYTTLGELLEHDGRTTDAISACLRAIMLAPTKAHPYRALGRVLQADGQFVEAAAVYRQAVHLEPTDAEAHIELATVLHAQGRMGEARERCMICLQLEPGRVDGYVRLGHLQLSRRDWPLAAISFRQGLDVCGDDAELFVGLGQALLGLGDADEALRAFQAALTTAPRNVCALGGLASVLERLERPDDAVEAWIALGNALAQEDRFDEAAVVFHRALARKPGSLRGRFGLGRVLAAQGKPALAIESLEAAISLDPQHSVVHVELGSACHLAGDLLRGWKESVWHRPPNGSEWRDFEQPVWDGARLDGRTILIWAAGALGDTIQFLRYVPLVKARGGRVVVECPRRLLPLVARMPAIECAVGLGTALPAFEVHDRLTRLPLTFGTRLSTVPHQVPYLSVDRDLIEVWRQRLEPDGRLTVGISWGGNAANRTAESRFVSLRAFAPLGGLRDVRVVCLQRGPQTAELLDAPAGLKVEYLQGESCSIADTAALMMNLDLIITVDTMIAHLAGALALPIWTVLPHIADWRWLMHTDESPWYPTMRLFRQRRPGDWADVFRRVRAALDAGNRKTRATPPAMGSGRRG